MNLSPTNSNTNLVRAQSPKFPVKSNKQVVDIADLDIPSSNPRRLGENLATESLALPQEERGFEVLNSVANTGRKLASKVLNFFGFTGATITGLFFMFGFKILSLFVAVPTVGALFIANHLKQIAKSKEDDLDLLTDPVKIVKKAKNDSLFLESNFNKVLAAMVKVGELKNTDARKQEALEYLSVIAKKVLTKKFELKATDKTNHELLDLNKFLDIYSTINPSEAQSQTELS